MKKSFKELKERSILSNFQMQNVVGGGNGHGSCGYLIIYEDGSSEFSCNVSKDIAIHMITALPDRENSIAETHWCCDSCASTSYCGN